MTLHEWHTQWARLNHFRTAGDVDRESLEAEWFAQVKHFHVEAVEHGITQLIGHAKENFLPGLGLLKDFIQARIGRYDRAPGKCNDCGGSGWIDATPFQSNGLIYANTLTRCTSCGIPAPKIQEHRHRRVISDLQAHEYQAGRFARDTMPDFAKAKHPDKPGNPELKKMIEDFRRRHMVEEVPQ